MTSVWPPCCTTACLAPALTCQLVRVLPRTSVSLWVECRGLSGAGTRGGPVGGAACALPLPPASSTSWPCCGELRAAQGRTQAVVTAQPLRGWPQISEGGGKDSEKTAGGTPAVQRGPEAPWPQAHPFGCPKMPSVATPSRPPCKETEAGPLNGGGQRGSPSFLCTQAHLRSDRYLARPAMQAYAGERVLCPCAFTCVRM